MSSAHVKLLAHVTSSAQYVISTCYIIGSCYVIGTIRHQHIFSLDLYFLNSFFLQPVKMTETLEILNIIFTSIFGLEMLAKVIAFGPYGYIKDPYNLFDGVIVIVR